MNEADPAALRAAVVVLAVDPGRAKCGVALVHEDGRTLHREVTSAQTLVVRVRDLMALYSPSVLVVGNGTGSKPLLRELEQAHLPIPLHPIDESYTSEAARRRYVIETPARGWQRLLPLSLRTPDQPYDDYVAVILAEHWLQRER